MDTRRWEPGGDLAETAKEIPSTSRIAGPLTRRLSLATSFDPLASARSLNAEPDASTAPAFDAHRATNQPRGHYIAASASRRHSARSRPAPNPTPFASMKRGHAFAPKLGDCSKSRALFDVADEVNSAIVPGCLLLHYEYLLLFICL